MHFKIHICLTIPSFEQASSLQSYGGSRYYLGAADEVWVRNAHFGFWGESQTIERNISMLMIVKPESPVILDYLLKEKPVANLPLSAFTSK